MHSLGQLKYSLALTLQYMRASEGLLELAIQRTPEGPVADYFVQHLKEERNHADWLAEDLGGEEAGIDMDAVAMAGSLYYLVRHVSPLCLLGYMLALEKPIPMERVEFLETLYGKALLRTVRVHAQEDPLHERVLLDLIHALPDADKAHVGLGYEWTRHYLIQIELKIQRFHQ